MAEAKGKPKSMMTPEEQKKAEIQALKEHKIDY